MSGRVVSTARATTVSTSTGSRTSRILPWRMRLHVEQVVEQLGHVLHLAVEDRAHLLLGRRCRRPSSAGLGDVADRGQPVAQLVAEHGQELVLRRSASTSRRWASLRSLMSRADSRRR
jgi:hypothetical protein